MGRIYNCVGRYAGTAYTIKNTWIRVYCVEELCYYICNNSYLLEDEFVSNELITWLEEECNLPMLVRRIRTQLRQNSRLEAFVRVILEELHYCSEEEIVTIEQMILANQSKTSVEKTKVLADYFLKNRRYALALKTYGELLDEYEKQLNFATRASVYYQIGVIYANLFLFEQAADHFKLAYSTYEREDYKTAYLAVNRLILSDDAYLKFISTVPDAYESTVVLEERLEQTLSEWKYSEEYRKQRGTEQLKAEGSIAEFCHTMDLDTELYKNEYRCFMAE